MKLPGINLNRVSLPSVQSPGTAVAEYQSRQAVARSLVTLGTQIAEVKREYDVGEASAAVADTMSEFERTYAGKQTFTPEEVEELGLQDVVQTSQNGEPREAIPAFEVYPYALQRQSEEALNQAAGQISDTALRQRWTTEMRSRHDEAVSNAVVKAGEDMFTAQVENLQDRAEVNQELGNFRVAQAAIMSMPISEDAKSVLLLDNKQKAARYEANQIMTTGTDEQLALLINAAETDEYLSSSGLSAEDARQIRSLAITEENRRDAQYVKDRTALEEQTATGLLLDLSSGRATSADVVNNANVLGYQYTKALLDYANIESKNRTQKTEPNIAIEFSQLLMDMEVGNYEAGDTLDSMYSKGKDFIFRNLTRYDDVTGALIPGIAPLDQQRYMDALDEAYRQTQESPTYKQILDNAKIRILNIAPDSIVATDTSEINNNLFAQYRFELLDYINKNGNDPELLKAWEAETLPGYLDNKGKSALQNIPRDLWKYAKYRKVDDVDVLDLRATTTDFQRAYKAYETQLQRNPGNQRIQDKAKQLEDAYLKLIEMVEDGQIDAVDTE